RERAKNRSPRTLGNAGQFALVSHFPHADPAQPELAEDGSGAAALLAAGVAAHAELRRTSLLDAQCCFGHGFCASLSSPGTGSRDGATAPGPRRRSWPWSRT